MSADSDKMYAIDKNHTKTASQGTVSLEAWDKLFSKMASGQAHADSDGFYALERSKGHSTTTKAHVAAYEMVTPIQAVVLRAEAKRAKKNLKRPFSLLEGNTKTNLQARANLHRKRDNLSKK